MFLLDTVEIKMKCLALRQYIVKLMITHLGQKKQDLVANNTIFIIIDANTHTHR